MYTVPWARWLEALGWALVSWGLGWLFAKWVSGWCWKHVAQVTDQKATRRPDPLPMVVGILERFLYTASYALGHPEFIALWFAAKVAPTFGSWEKDRARFNAFLVGSGVSILFGVVGGIMVRWSLTGEPVLTPP